MWLILSQTILRSNRARRRLAHRLAVHRYANSKHFDAACYVPRRFSSEVWTLADVCCCCRPARTHEILQYARGCAHGQHAHDQVAARTQGLGTLRVKGWPLLLAHSGKLKLPPGVAKPKQTLASKRFIGKVMLLCAIARPSPQHQFDYGLVGAWHVCERVPAKRGDKRTGLKKGDLRTVDVVTDADKFESMIYDAARRDSCNPLETSESSSCGGANG
mmetsp:Transcript_1396/g.4558  ORF Transcript_1396/g.4558 Transcript_1396/m.4558 type:complete len:217 (-) Transcript_1396:269-919(-)